MSLGLPMPLFLYINGPSIHIEDPGEVQAQFLHPLSLLLHTETGVFFASGLHSFSPLFFSRPHTPLVLMW